MQQFGQGAFEGDFKARVGAEAGENALVLRVEHGHAHDRVLTAERGILDQYAEAGVAQALDAGGDGRVAGNDFFRYVGQAKAFGDDLELDVAFEDFRQRLGAGLGLRVAGRHAVADVEVADDVDRHEDLGAVTLAHVGNGANATVEVAGVDIDQRLSRDVAIRVVEGLQLRRQQVGRPVGAIFRQRKPAFAWVVGEFAVGNSIAKVVVVPEIIARQALEILAERAGVGGQFGRALAVGEHQVAGAIAHMHGPDVIDRIQPRAFLDVEAAGQQFGLHRGNGVFERGIFARNKVFLLHRASCQKCEGGVYFSAMAILRSTGNLGEI